MFTRVRGRNDLDENRSECGAHWIGSYSLREMLGCETFDAGNRPFFGVGSCVFFSIDRRFWQKKCGFHLWLEKPIFLEEQRMRLLEVVAKSQFRLRRSSFFTLPHSLFVDLCVCVYAANFLENLRK